MKSLFHSLFSCRLFLTIVFICNLFQGYGGVIIGTDVQGNVWIETDGNSMYNGESVSDGVPVELWDTENMVMVASTVTLGGLYKFSEVQAGKYFIRIPQEAFYEGAGLENMASCPGANPADDGIDNDDNGLGSSFEGVRSSEFTLTNEDPNVTDIISYIDFCFTLGCGEENPLASHSCDAIGGSEIICDINFLGGFCSVMSPVISGGNQPKPLCQDGNSQAENISWFGFVAWDGIYDIVITSSGCVAGNIGVAGVQVGLYTSCDFTENVFCDDDCNVGSIVIPSSVLIPGQTYYLFINGCGGSVCNYMIDITGSPGFPTIDPSKICFNDNDEIICDSTSYCIGRPVFFEVSNTGFDGVYTWSVNTLSGGPFVGDTLFNTTQSLASLTFINEGDYEICILAVNNACDSWQGQECQKITITSDIPVVADEFFSGQFVCSGDIASFDQSFLSAYDPNGDGNFGWQAQDFSFALGTNINLAFSPMCNYEQYVDINEYEDEVYDVNLTVCDADLPLIVGALTIGSEDFNFANIYSIDDLLVDIPNQNGCDSIINLTVERLVIDDGFILDPVCDGDGLILDFDYNVSGSTSGFYISFQWKSPNGAVILDNFNTNDKTDVKIPLGSTNGTYTFMANVSKDGKLCTYNYSVVIDFETFQPLDPQLTGSTSVCEGQLAEYQAFNGESLNYIWFYPDDVSVTISGSLGELLTVDWTGSSGGNIGVMIENGCGFSDTVFLEVEVFAMPLSSIIASFDSICLDSEVSVYFGGNINSTATYTWDFGGAAILNGTNGSGPGPHILAWSDIGSKSISLVVKDFNGCFSEPAIAIVEVIATPLPVIATCMTSINEVTFSWTSNPGFDAYQVIVTSGQQGAMTGATQYTVSDLLPGEEVSIIIKAIPSIESCLASIDTEISCVAQDCPPIDIELSVPMSSICFDSNTPTMTIAADVTTTLSGIGNFSGPGIVNPIGIFDPKVAGAGTHTIQYIFISGEGCSASESTVVVVTETPNSSFTLSETIICITESINASYTGSANIDSYHWIFDGSGQTDIANPTITFDAAGIKNISLYVENDGCLSDTVIRQIEVDDELSPLLIECTSGEGSVQFSWNAVEGATFYEVSINGDDPIITDDLGILIDQLGSEEFVTILLVALSDGACPDVSKIVSCKSLLINGVDEEFTNVNIHPNPAFEVITVSSPYSYKAFRMYDALGKEVLGGAFESQVDVSSLVPGVYMMRLYIDQYQMPHHFKILKL